MLRLLDTSVAIPLIDLDPDISARVAGLSASPVLSVLTVVELAGGVASSGAGQVRRREALDTLLSALSVLPFRSREAALFGEIVARIGYSRSKVIDRMIAATAMSADATLATLNARDFKGIAGLKLEDWSA